MAPMSPLVLLFTCITGIFAQERQLMAAPVTQGDCFLSCWRTAGFCDWCGGGNACCATDGTSREAGCGGVKFQGSTSPYQCAKPSAGATPSAYNRGQQRAQQQAVDQAPASHTAISDIAKAQCITFMSQEGCGWTHQFSCPGQATGSNGFAKDDRSVGYNCCCHNKMWQEVAPDMSKPGNPAVNQAACNTYQQTTGCAWTAQNNCPGQRPGTSGPAFDDESLGYDCCCRNGGWQNALTWDGKSFDNNQVGTAGYKNGNDPNAFNVDHVMDPNVRGQDLLANTADNGIQIAVAPGQQTGTGVRNNGDADFYYNHKGPNIHTHTMRVTDTNFKGTEHHGAIHNEFSDNSAKAKKERCQFGLCSPINAGPEVGNGNNLPDTQHGMPVLKGTANAPVTLPSIVASMNDGDSKPQILKVTGAVATASTPLAGGGVMAPAAAPAAAASVEPAPGAGPVLNARVGVPAAPVMSAKMAAPAAAAPVLPGAAAPAAAPEVTVETTLSSPVGIGATEIPVADGAGFLIGDQILVGPAERKTIVATSAGDAATASRRLGGATITLDSPLASAYPANTTIQKIPESVLATLPQQGGSSGSVSGSFRASSTSGQSSSIGKSSGGYGLLVLLVIVCCIVIAGGGVGAFMMMGRKKKRATTDREAYLKNDFIERQPVYHDVPENQETEPMMSQKGGMPIATMGVDVNGDGRADMVYTGVDMNQDGIPDALQAPNPLQPTVSFPVQVELAPIQQAVPVTNPSGVSFPGLPTIGGGSSLLQQTMAAPSTMLAPSTSQYFQAQPQAVSMNMTMPYGNYASPSTYVSAPQVYNQQLGMTTSLPQYSAGGVV